MSKAKNYKLFVLIVLLAISFALLQIGSGLVFGSHKKDFTSFHRYADNAQAVENIKKMQYPVNVTLYMSENLGDEYPSLGAHSQHILRILEKFQSAAGGKINITVKNPQPYSTVEKEARRNRIRPFPNVTADADMYFGASFINERGEKHTIPYFSVQRQNYAEYDLARVFAKLGGGFKKQTVGIVSFATPLKDDMLFLKQLRNDYDVVKIGKDELEIPMDVDVLIAFNPQRVSPSMTYALDQYILRGGKLIILTDPYSELAVRQNPSGNLYKNGIEPILKNLGLVYNHETVIGDAQLSYDYKQIKNGGNVTHFELSPQYADTGLPFVSGILKLKFRSPGSLELDAKETAVYTPLFRTSEQAGTVNASLARFASPESINAGLKSERKSFVLGYLVEGWFESLFEDNIIQGTPQARDMLPFIIGSIEKSQVIVIADTDFLDNDTWNDTVYDEQASVYDLIPSASNADFLLNAVDFLSGNELMLGIAPNYLYNTDQSAGEQLYNRIFGKYAKQYNDLEKRLVLAQKRLEQFNADIRSQKINLSIGNIKELENLNRSILAIREELKHFEYILKMIQEDKVNAVIFHNTVTIPLVIILIVVIGTKVFNRRRKQKIKRLINE